ncbi:RNA-dependent ATPase [Ophidiomyces ophidiicola]|uniref:RNA-dependent ATPase n=1 Tax=Ophidiomyces ophidiicola TaxID=1387563 RepID=A0ACB8UV25_9EURO|nr:RNA-dependent ATPase [Ophidiomyces ophidiicola]KAI1914588.1 RNA-dependent ATPase [Ophidiomyces ophidiicola]KAI1944712.1 RNA-dependent ATPase [Ophidiomyces ophidiicola]KAI1945679.1 RNA-dependent ATPase [Ophidiomyces ophidiicola]KAI2005121.1 RNA-dependent ATPase [Ophidiomyces ophidiicola]KAI2022804.1 RNA-dependent ATPase [Ophidiomyces ophidiicola]
MAKHLLPVDPDTESVAQQPQKKRKKKQHKSDQEKTATPRDETQECSLNGDNDGDSTSISGYVPSADLLSLPQSSIDEFLSTNSIKVASSSEEQNARPILSFSYLPKRSDSLYRPLENFSKPTPIQAVSWPFAFSGRDVIGVAETGSGKTLAFGLPCLRKVLELKRTRKPRRPSSVIITPTRELAMQIYDELRKFTATTELGIACIYGGAPKERQRQEIKAASIVVATPGRLKDLQSDQSIDLSKVKFLVLDEADRMLDKGFEQDIRDIIGAMPSTKKRQTIMFTATWPTSVRNLATAFTKHPITITVGESDSSDIRANERIKQVVEVLKPHEKDNRLIELLRKYNGGKKSNDRILVFCLYKKEAMRVERFIRSKGFKVAGIHGDMNQTDRFSSLEAFKSGSTSLLVATDVAARGLDIPAVKLVLNVTFPLTVEDYVHRIGRTGRAGAEGLAITLFTEHDKGLSGPLINVLRAAKQGVPESLLKFGATVKKKQHDSYGAFFRDVDTTKVASKITFDD